MNKCQYCGCTDLAACVNSDGTPCCWYTDDLCSRCAEYFERPVLVEVAEERMRQDAKWGGTAHDDTNSEQGWHDLITRIHFEAKSASHRGESEEYRRFLVELAAVACAAVEALDRKRGDDDV